LTPTKAFSDRLNLPPITDLREDVLIDRLNPRPEAVVLELGTQTPGLHIAI